MLQTLIQSGLVCARWPLASFTFFYVKKFVYIGSIPAHIPAHLTRLAQPRREVDLASFDGRTDTVDEYTCEQNRDSSSNRFKALAKPTKYFQSWIWKCRSKNWQIWWQFDCSHITDLHMHVSYSAFTSSRFEITEKAV